MIELYFSRLRTSLDHIIDIGFSKLIIFNAILFNLLKFVRKNFCVDLVTRYLHHMAASCKTQIGIQIFQQLNIRVVYSVKYGSIGMFGKFKDLLCHKIGVRGKKVRRK